MGRDDGIHPLRNLCGLLIPTNQSDHFFPDYLLLPDLLTGKRRLSEEVLPNKITRPTSLFLLSYILNSQSLCEAAEKPSDGTEATDKKLGFIPLSRLTQPMCALWLINCKNSRLGGEYLITVIDL